MKVFIGGSRSISCLDTKVQAALFEEFNSGAHIIVGDADGIDSQIQQFCFLHGYKNVTIYASNGKARNNFGKFPINNVAVDSHTFSKNFYTAKDIAMTNHADYGIVIWDGKSKGSLNQLYRMVKQNKPCKVFMQDRACWVELDSEQAIKDLNLTTQERKHTQLSFF